MTKIYYPNCSELIADFKTKDAKMFLDMVKKIGKKYGWVFDPPLSIEILETMKHENRLEKLGVEQYVRTEITVIDKKGQQTTIEFGSNGYDDSLGFRFDSGCEHGDETQFEFFDIAIKECQAEMECFDGGSLASFEEWQESHG